ncbi:MAG: alternative ribosome rescue aminoacyl-tRNA hydrolase ArfB [Phycisphaerales bacterium]
MSVRDEAFESGIEVAPGVRMPPGLISLEFVSSSGPGGQNVNKRATKAQLRVSLADIPISDEARARLAALAGARLNTAGVIIISSGETRSQKRNRQACLARLRELVVRALYPPRKRRPTRIPRRAVERRLEDKRRRSQTKQSRRPPDREH